MLKKNFFLFALVGLFSISLHAEKLDGIAAIVNDSIITEQELQSNIKEVRQQISQGGINAPGDAELRRQVLQHLIDVSLQTEIAKSNNIMVEPEHLKQALKNIAQKNNISLSNLKKTIESQGMSWTKYKDNIKKELLMVKIQQNAVGQITVPESQVDDYIKSNQHKQHIQYHLKDIVLSLPEAPTPEQIKKAKQQANALKKQLQGGLDFSKAAIEKSSGEVALGGGDLGYRTLASMPSMFVNVVVNMKKGDIAGPIRAPNGFHIIKLEELKGEMGKQLVTLTNVKHILLKVEPGVSSQERQKEIIKIYQQINRGSTFSQMAKKFSMDKKSAKDGGSLGWVHKGELVPKFEEAMDKLKVGELSKPIKTNYGWHLIKVVKRKQIDDSRVYQRQMVQEQLYQRQFSVAVQQWLQQLRASAYIKVMSKV